MRARGQVVLCYLLGTMAFGTVAFGTVACATTASPPDTLPQPKCHVAYLVGPFRYPNRKQDVADELRTHGWQVTDKLGPGVDTIVFGQEPSIATCGGFVDHVDRGAPDSIDAFDLLRCPGCEIVYWSRLQMQFLCDDLAK